MPVSLAWPEGHVQMCWVQEFILLKNHASDYHVTFNTVLGKVFGILSPCR